MEAQFIGIRDPYGVLGNGFYHGDYVRLLEASLSYTEVALVFECINLSCDEHGRDRVEVSIADAGDKVGRTGTGCGISNSGFARSLGISACREGSSLLVISNV